MTVEGRAGSTTNRPADRPRRFAHARWRSGPRWNRVLTPFGPKGTIKAQQGGRALYAPHCRLSAHEHRGPHVTTEGSAPDDEGRGYLDRQLHLGIADDVLRDLYVCGAYREVILPMIVRGRLDAVLAAAKTDVLVMKENLDAKGIVNQEAAMKATAKQPFYNTSAFSMSDLRNRANRKQLKADFEDFLDGFSNNVQDILTNFEFRNQVPRLTKGDDVGTLIEKLLDPDLRLSGVDNHAMG